MDLLSVRARLTAWNVGVVAMVLILAGLAVRYLLQASLMATVDADLGRAGDRAARAYPTLRLPTTPFAKSPKPQSRKPSADDLFTSTGRDLRPRVLDPTGQDYRPEGTIGPWDAAAFRQALAGTRVLTTIRSEGDWLRVMSVPGVRNGRIEGVIQWVQPLAPVERALDQLTKTLLILVPAALLIAALGGAFLTGRALRPVREIAEAASEIQAENLSARLPVRGRDEFARLTQVLNGMLERLEGAFQRQRRFTGDASHELRTPLATIKATSSLAYEDEWDAPACHTALRNIEKAADRAERIVDGLLLLARADSDTLVREGGCVPLAAVVAAAVEVVEAARESRPGESAGPPIRTALPSSPATVAVDTDQLTRVFVNLLENAVRHTPAGGEITISALGASDEVVVTVRDTGEGIAPEHLPHLTERFYRADSARTRARGGAGLGLAICRTIVEAHGGRMDIQSEPGHGTEITLRLPAASSLK